MNDNDIRRDQQIEGQRRTLTTKPGYRRESSGGKKPFVAKGHDAILKRVQDAGGTLRVSLLGDGSTIRGKLIARDKFTITLEVTGESGIEQITVYKHAIESFCGLAREE